jgi:hypothetical protein
MADRKYGELKPELVKLLKDYERLYFREGRPVPFIPESNLFLYPAQVRDFEEFAACSSCLTLNKNDDPRGVTMSHLDYLLSKIASTEPEARVWRYKIQRLFEIVFRLQVGYECTTCHTVIPYNSQEAKTFLEQCQAYAHALQERMAGAQVELPPEPRLKCKNAQCSGTKFQHSFDIREDPITKKMHIFIHGHDLTKNEFNQLRQIVLFQNLPDYADDSWRNSDIRKDHDEAMRLKQQSQDLHATIEQKVICLAITSNYKIPEIYDMPIRQFTMALTRVDDLINYKLLQQAKYSGMSSIPSDFKIPHWIYQPDTDSYDDMYKDVDSFQSV